MTWNGSMVRHLNGFLAQGGGDLNTTSFFKKFKCPGCCSGGSVEATLWLVHYRPFKRIFQLPVQLPIPYLNTLYSKAQQSHFLGIYLPAQALKSVQHFLCYLLVVTYLLVDSLVNTNRKCAPAYNVIVIPVNTEYRIPSLRSLLYVFWETERLSKDRFWLARKTIKMTGSKIPRNSHSRPQSTRFFLVSTKNWDIWLLPSPVFHD